MSLKNYKSGNTVWKEMQRLASLIIDSDIQGTIYGGYIRDKILHDTHASRWYRATGRYGIYYIDSTPHVENTYGKMVLPTDIDCVVSYKNLGIFFSKLFANDWMIHTMVTASSKFTQYSKKVHDVYHYKLEVVKSNISQPFESYDKGPRYITFKIDVLFINYDYHPDLVPPFGMLDFECNGLMLTADGIKVMEGRLDLETIKQQIDEMKAVRASDSTPQYRIDKMMEKGWEVST